MKWNNLTLVNSGVVDALTPCIVRYIGPRCIVTRTHCSQSPVSFLIWFVEMCFHMETHLKNPNQVTGDWAIARENGSRRVTNEINEMSNHANWTRPWSILISTEHWIQSANKPWVGLTHHRLQATGLDAWASRVKCPARFVSHLHDICIYIWVVYSFCLFCCLFIVVMWWYVWCIEWESGNQKEVQACLVTLCLFIISCYSLYKTTV